MKVNFKCKECGFNKIEEVMEGVRKYSIISHAEMTDTNYVGLQYGDCNDEDGELLHYQCAGCGNEIEGCWNPESLYNYLKKNNMLEK